MIHQYYASRCRLRGERRIPVGTVPVGTIVYLQDVLRPLVGFTRPRHVCRNPWIVTAWLPRETFGGFFCRHCDRAVVRSLRDGRETRVQEWVLLAHDDEGLTVPD